MNTISIKRLKSRYGLSEVPEHFGKLNLSALIRACKAQNPKFTSADIISHLAEDGLTIKDANVRMAMKVGEKKAKAKLGHRARKIVKIKRPAKKRAADTTTIEALLSAKKFINQCGSIEAASLAIKTIDQLTN